MKIFLILVVLLAIAVVGIRYFRIERARRLKEQQDHLRRSIAVTKRHSGIYGPR